MGNRLLTVLVWGAWAFLLSCGESQESTSEQREVKATDLNQASDSLVYAGKETKPYSGRAIHHDNLGRKTAQVHFVKGRMDGLETRWYANGNKRSEMTWHEGRKSGPYNLWHENKRLQETGAFKSDNKHGSVIAWDTVGREILKGSWRRGQFSGTITERLEDGHKGKERIFNDGVMTEERLTSAVREKTEKIREQRRELDATVWQPEVMSQEYENVFVSLWDELRAATDKYEPLKRFAFGRIVLSESKVIHDLDAGIRSMVFGNDSSRDLGPKDWIQFLTEYKSSGYQIVETEWHHQSFVVDADGRSRSVVAVVVHALNRRDQHRYILRGKLYVDWQKGEVKIGNREDTREGSTSPYPSRIELVELRIFSRQGAAPFRESVVLNPAQDNPASRFPSVDYFLLPLITYDLNRDGLSDIICPSANLIYWNRGNFAFDHEVMVSSPSAMPKRVRGGLVADFNGDGLPDLFLVGSGWSWGGAKMKAPFRVFLGTKNGRFVSEPMISNIHAVVQESAVCTAGDIDGDNDLDLWVVQYKSPYKKGSFPTPYYDANDGYPSFLLINDGMGRFTEGTEQAGLSSKRNRRSYSTSFVDLEHDGDLDLVVISDFSGLDIYSNDGNGYFTDMTHTLGDDRFSFGMSHAFGDFNEDGYPDLFMTGMGSTTARRISQLSLGRQDFQDHQIHRMKMGYGNRLFLSSGQGLRQASYNDQVARTGWSWGCTAFDFDNDGDRDFYIANGHMSRKSCKDYCSTFWRHDIYMGNSNNNLILDALYNEDHGQVFTDTSWNGYEHNALLMNEANQEFYDVAFLMNLSHEYDARGVIGDDLDADGRPDVLIVESAWNPQTKYETEVVHIDRNQWSSGHHWIGVRLYEHGGGFSPVGARITVQHGGKKQILPIATGDSYHAQHANVRHFGLGVVDRVDYVEVRWPNGKISRLSQPSVDQYHDVRPE